MSHQHYHHRNPKALLTSAMHGVLDRMARTGHVPLHALSPQQARLAYAAGTSGTLAAACAIEARDAGFPLALQLLFYPGCAGHQTSASHRTFAQGFVLEAPHITYFFNHYVRSARDRNDWRFSPLDGVAQDGQVVNLDGVAPAWMGLAECDPLVDEGVEYADRLRMAGVPVELEIYRGVVHEFIKMGRAIPEAARAHADAAHALRNRFLEA
jgi:acetyl esterase